MDIAVIADTVSAATLQTIGFAKFILNRHHLFSAAILPKDALAPQPVKSSSRRTVRRTLRRKKRLTKSKSYSGGDSEDSSEGESFFGGGNDDGSFGGGGYGGRGWNFDGCGGQNWDGSSRWSSNDFAFDFVYEVIYWIALSNCVHFAFKKLARFITDADRGKGRMRLTVSVFN